MGFPRQEYWSGWPFPSPGDLPDPGIEPMSLASPALAGSFTAEPLGKPYRDLERLNKKRLKVKVKLLSRVRLFATLWTVSYQAPPTMGFSRQEYWSGLSLPSPYNLLI